MTEKYIRDAQNRCIEVKNHKVKEGADIHLGEPRNTPAQQWKISHVEDGYCTIDLLGTGYCLDIKANTIENGQPVILWVKNGGHNQQWKFKYRGAAETDGRSQFSIHSRMDDNYVLDVKWNSRIIASNSFASLIIWNGHFEKNQLFKCDEAGLLI